MDSLPSDRAPPALDLKDKTRKKWATQPASEHILSQVSDMTVENITPHVIAVNSTVKDNPRLQYIITKIIQRSHDFIREVDLKFDEWRAAWEYLTRVSTGTTKRAYHRMLSRLFQGWANL